MKATLASFIQNINSLKEFFPDQWEETGMGKPGELNPDIETYINLEKMNKLILVLLTKNDILAGYYTGIITNPIQSKSQSVCIQTDLYIKPEYRGKYGERKIFSIVEKRAKKLGAQKNLLATRSKKDIGKIFERYGYEKEETYYSKVI